jgi:signal transduction histidine kinase
LPAGPRCRSVALFPERVGPMFLLHRVDLKLRLMLCTALVSLVCYATVGTWALLRAGDRAHTQAAHTAITVARDLALQQQRATWLAPPLAVAGLTEIAPFLLSPGLCIEREQAGQVQERICGGPDAGRGQAPAMLTWLYGWLADPARPAERSVHPGDPRAGSVVVRPELTAEAAEAWESVRGVLAALGFALVLLWLLLALAVQHLLRPTACIRAGLARLAAGDLSARLPPFDLGELSAIGTVFNRLAERLGATLAERDALMRRLLIVQDEERSALARDLHDEFGQCLAASAALVAALRQEAASHHAGLVGECEAIARILGRMQATLRDMLPRLRPPDLEALGLAASFDGLAASWGSATPSVRLQLAGDPNRLPPAMQVALYRIAQEAITNAARHAGAREIVLRLETAPDRVRLAVEDDGPGNPTLAPDYSGQGLLGMRERAASFGGTLSLGPRRPVGHVLDLQLPLLRTDAK